MTLLKESTYATGNYDRSFFFCTLLASVEGEPSKLYILGKLLLAVTSQIGTKSLHQPNANPCSTWLGWPIDSDPNTRIVVMYYAGAIIY